MKKKAFTLIELIAVLAILSIIIVISVPQLISMIEDSKENTRERIYKLISSAARIYASDHNLGESEPILISDLCTDNYLDCPVEDPVTEEAIDGYVFGKVDPVSKAIAYEIYEGTPTSLNPTLIGTVNGKDVAVNKYAGNGLYKNGSEYIYRGGYTRSNPAGLETHDGYVTDTISGTDVNNYVKVPWETYSAGETCSEGFKCWRIIKINSDGSIKLVKQINHLNQMFDNVHNTDASNYFGMPAQNYGYNDMLDNIPSTGHPEEYRSESQMYTALYGPVGYQKTVIYPYRNILTEMNVCLNKVQHFKGINNTLNPTYVNDTCNITGKPNTVAVSPLQEQYVGLLYPEEYLNASTETTCTASLQYQCRNQNFIYNQYSSWFTSGYSLNSWSMWFLNANGFINYYNAAYLIGIRPVVLLKSTVIISGGSGTAADPYVIMG